MLRCIRLGMSNPAVFLSLISIPRQMKASTTRSSYTPEKLKLTICVVEGILRYVGWSQGQERPGPIQISANK